MTESEHDHLLELAHGYIEGALGPEQVRELEALLDAEPAARRAYLDFVHDHASLHWDRVGAETAEAGDELVDYRPTRFPSLWQSLAAAAVIALLALILIRPAGGPESFAVMESTEAAQWASGDLPTARGARLAKGSLELLAGLATVRFDSGAQVVLEGPAELELLDAMNCRLAAGTAVAEVGESAQGFVIETPSARLVDHGTRFAVNVASDSGATQTQVFDGLVEVELSTTRQSIELREGQRTFVSGDTIGAVSESPEEGAWSRPPHRHVPGAGWRVLTTGRHGHDAYVWGGEPNDHVSDELLLLKNSRTPDGPHRKAYLRFDLGSLRKGPVADASLTLHFTPTGWGLASLLQDSVFEVFGLVDDSLDDWRRDRMAWKNAPANVLDSGDALQSDKVVSLGAFTVPRGVQSGSFGISGEPLARFLEEDANRRATLIIVRRTSENRSGGLVHGIASARHPTLPPPSLAVKVER